ncbi:MAG: proline iminopeptidase-family hydrolase [Pseudomonadota bacterium]
MSDMRSDTFRPDREGKIAVTGGQIWYGITGQLDSGALPLLVLHGGPGMNHLYLSPLSDLADERAVIFYDQLDAGASDWPNDPVNWTIDRFLAEIDAVRDALHLKELAIFGNSWGGTLAAAYGATQPEGLAGLVLSSPLIRTATWIADNAAYRAALPQDTQAILSTCEAEGRTDDPSYEEAVEVFYRRHLCRATPWPEFLQRSLETMNLACYGAMWGPNEFTCTGVLADYDGADALAKIAVPTLFTFGAFDEATPESTSAFSKKVPGATFELFEASSHMAFIEERDAYIASLRNFLKSIETKGD